MIPLIPTVIRTVIPAVKMKPAVGVAVAVLLLPYTAACSSEASRRPAVPVAAASTPTPERLTPESAAQAFTSYVTNDDVARISGDERLALSWASDGQAQLIAAEFRKAAFTGDPVPRYRYGTPAFHVPRLTSYPQWFVSVVDRTDLAPGGEPGRTRLAMLAFIRKSAGDRWRLSLSTLPGKKDDLPTVTVDGEGYATALATFEDGLLIQPRGVPSIQSTLAEDGPASVASKVMRNGPNTSGLYVAGRQAERKAKEDGLAYGTVYRATQFPIFSLRTDDGGALVLYALTRDTVTYVKRPEDGRPIPREAAHLLDTIVLKNQLSTIETLQFAAIDPPKPKAGKKQPKADVIAKDGAVTKATTQ